MKFRLFMFAACFLIAGWTSSTWAKGPAYSDPGMTDADFPFQGEYQGELETPEQKIKLGIQVIALGGGKFRSVAHIGGLPGDGWDGKERPTVDGERQGDIVIFENDGARGEIKNNVLKVTSKDGAVKGDLPKVARQSPSLGQKPPAGAVVLFDGTSADAWEGGRLSPDQLLMEGCTSKQKFGNQRLHIEFRLPYMPEESGQGRGNSGLYLQGRYEVQMLDSFGLEGKQNECGGIYSVKDPDLNMCFPPLAWQTYDVEYLAAKYDADGKLSAKPRITVRHNGVVIHNNVELPGDRNTTAAPVPPGPEPGPIFLQNHGNPVRYRNIWVAPL